MFLIAVRGRVVERFFLKLTHLDRRPDGWRAMATAPPAVLFPKPVRNEIGAKFRIRCKTATGARPMSRGETKDNKKR
jgi:hypothetical protein